jgi:hypothetical protein
MDQAVSKALKEKEELQKRLAEIEQFLRLYREFSEATQSDNKEKPSVDKLNESTQINDKSLTSRPKIPRVKMRPRGPRHVVSFSRGILQDIGEPLTRGELVSELETKNVLLPGADKESRARYVGTILWRHPKEFEHIPGRGYWLKGEPIPETEQEKRDLKKRNTL